MLLGYARVSTDDQNLNLQREALNGAGCDRLFEDCASGTQSDRAGLRLLLEVARAGDTVMVWRLDRLARSLKDLIALVERLDAASVGLKSLREHIDTTSSGGKLVFHLLKRLDVDQRALALRLHQERQHPIADICRMMGISKSTLYSYLDEAQRRGG